MLFIRSFLFNIALFAWTFLILLLYLPLLATPRRILVKAVKFWACGILFLQKTLLDLKFEFRGLSSLPDVPYIIACAHQSAWETIAFYAVVEDPGYLVKRELYKVPLFGAYARRLRMVRVNREGRAGEVRKMIREVKKRLQEGRPVVIFPGGTRSAPDEIVQLKAGINALYRQCGVPVVPVSLISGVFWGRRSFVKTPGVIVAEFHEPIEPGKDISTFSQLLTQRINSGNRRLLTEATGHDKS